MKLKGGTAKKKHASFAMHITECETLPRGGLQDAGQPPRGQTAFECLWELWSPILSEQGGTCWNHDLQKDGFGLRWVGLGWEARWGWSTAAAPESTVQERFTPQNGTGRLTLLSGALNK